MTEASGESGSAAATRSFPSDADVDAVIQELAGDMREAVRALLHDLEILASDYEASVSHGFVRSGIPRAILSRRL